MLRGLDPALEESAWSLGHSRGRTFRTVVLPQLRPAMLGGALLVGLHLLAEFGALQMLRFPTFTTAIYDQYRSTFNGAAANMIAGVLVLLCLLLLLAELRLRGHRRYARVGHGARPRREPVAARAVALAAGGRPRSRWSCLAVGVPTYSLLHWLVVGTSTEFPLGELAAAAGTTVGLALARRRRHHAGRGAGRLARGAPPRRPRRVIERSTYVANALPGIVVALALVAASIRVVPAVYQTAGCCSWRLRDPVPAARRRQRARRARAGAGRPRRRRPQPRHAGRSTTARRVTLPLIAPGLGAGAALVFLAVSTELTATLMLSPIGTRTLATEFWSASSALRYGAAAPYALLMVLISIPATILLMRIGQPATRTETMPA